MIATARWWRRRLWRRADLGWKFVPIDRSYWFANACADVTAEWFVDLGCSVGWAPIRASLAVAR